MQPPQLLFLIVLLRPTHGSHNSRHRPPSPQPTGPSFSPTTWEWRQLNSMPSPIPTSRPTLYPTPAPSLTPAPSSVPSSIPSPAPTAAPVAAPLVWTEARLRDALGGGFDADLNASIVLTSTLVFTDSFQEIKSTGAGKLVGDGTFRLIDIGASSRRRLADASTSEVRLKHLELIGGSAEEGGAIRVAWPASLYAHDVTFTANSASVGGAVYVHATFAQLSHCLFRRNNASDYGGVLYAAGNSSQQMLNGSHAYEAGALVKVTHGVLTENRAPAGAAFAAYYAHLELKHMRTFFVPTWDHPLGDQEVLLRENGTAEGCHNEPHFNVTGRKRNMDRCWDSGDEASLLLYELAILCCVLIVAIAAGGCVLGSARLVYGYCCQHWKCPDLGALGARLYYDDHRGECYCGVFFATCFSTIALVAAFLAAGEVPDMIEAFGFARLDSTDPTTYIIIGLKGYIVVADEIGGDDTVPSDDVSGNKVYVPFGAHAASRNPCSTAWTALRLHAIDAHRTHAGASFGDDDEAGSDYDWTGMCAQAGEQAYGALYPVALVKILAAFIVYRRVDTEKDSWYWKFLGVGVECLSTVLVLNILLYFSFDCLMQLPTGSFFVPASDDGDTTYAYAADDAGESYVVDAAYPYTSFLFTIVSGMCSLFVAYVHWRTPTWNSEMVEKLY